ncbi:SDR family NAD(P)-dependent oxidoreductase [Myxococcota bacterium]|nr:SDR family NAD(P)-dependent oxidoreductase [Myxococcota bacterium]
MRDFTDRVAVITGGASGVGRALAAALVAQGARVVIADVEEEALRRTAAELSGSHGEVDARVTDVSDAASVTGLADHVFATKGAVHLLFNNAGVGLGEAQRRIWTLPETDWSWGLGVNVWGVIHGIRAFVPRMLEGGEEGWVVNTSSGNGGLTILPTTPIYSATKAALTSITETLHYQLLMEEASIGASALFPGPHLVNTNILNSGRNRPPKFAAPDSQPASYVSMEELAQSSGVQFRLSEPEDVAAYCLEGIREGRFWILPPSEDHDARVRQRYEGILARANPPLPD